MAQNKNITVRLLADASQYEATMSRAGAKTETLAGGLEKTGSKTGLITTGLMTAGLAVAAFGVAAVKTAADFDQQMSTVQANTQASSGELDLLRAAAIKAGADTVFSASEAADGINELGKAGLSVTDILSGGLSGALNLAAADGMSVGSAAELMSTTLKQFNLTGREATKVADALAAGAGKAVGSASDLGQALNQSGLMAHSMGIGMQETVGTLAAFANAGMIGSDAGTSLKTALQRLSNPTDQAKETMDGLGLSAYDAQGKFVGLKNFAGQLQDKMSGLTDQQRNAALATIFGSDAVRAANVLYEQGADGIAKWTKDVSDSGYAAQMAAAKNNNLKGDIENLSGSFESFMIKVGEGGQGPLRSVVQTLDTLVDGFGNLPAPVSQSIVVAGALIGVFAGLHKVMTPLNTSTSGLAQSVGLAIDPIQRLSAAAPQLKSGFSDLAGAFTSSFSALSSGTPAVGASSQAMGGLKSIAGGVMNLMGGPWGIALSVAGVALGEFAQSAKEAQDRTNQLQSALESTGDASAALVDIIQKKQIGGVDKINQWITQTKTGVKTLPELLGKAGLSISDLAKAAEGNKPALAKYNAAIDANRIGTKGLTTTGYELQKQLNDIKSEYDKASEGAKAKKKATDDLKGSDDAAKGATKGSTDAIKDQQTASEDAAKAIDNLIKNLFGLESENLTADESVTRLNQKILDMTGVVNENGRCLDENGNALKGNEKHAYATQSSLQDLADASQQAAVKILQQGQASGDMDGATKRANDTLAHARDAFINTAIASGMSRDAAYRLADSYGFQEGKVDDLKRSIDNLPNSHNTDIYATDHATPVISSVRDALLGLRDRTVTLNQVMNYVQTGEKPNSYGPFKDGLRTGGATGGMFNGSRFLPGYADGGTISGLMQGPGTGTSDSIWLRNARVANGEFVEQKKSVDYYGAQLFDDLNHMRIPREVFSKPAPVPVLAARHMDSEGGKIVYNQYVTNEIHSTGSSHVDAALLAARVRAGTGAMLQGRTL